LLTSRQCTVMLGLDGVSVDMLETLMADGTMPNLAELSSAGRLGRMASSVPEVPSVAWTSTLTGASPGVHGIFGFTDIGSRYKPHLSTMTDVRTAPLWEDWNARGLKTAFLNVPSTYPAPKRINGIVVSGFPSIDVRKASSPRSLALDLLRDGYRVDVRAQLAHEDTELFFDDLMVTLDARQAAWRKLWSLESWDLFFHVITGTDRLLHFFYAAFEDVNHPHYADFRAYFSRVDECVGEIREAQRKAGGGPFFVLSEHGFGPLRQEIMTNGVLEELGFFSADPTPGAGIEGIHDSARAFALDPARIYVHDMSYSRGCVRNGSRSAVVDEIAGALMDYTVDGDRPVSRVYRAAEIYRGPALSSAPDLVVIGADGWDFKGRIDSGPTVRPSLFTGKHTGDNAFFLAAGDVNGDLMMPRDVTGVKDAVGVTVFGGALVA
jgi:predicted AlkP superfamily phosphohydrolase/phosphomutase